MSERSLNLCFYSSGKRDYDYLFGSLIYNVLYISLQNHFYIMEEKYKKKPIETLILKPKWLCIEKEKMTFTGL